MGLTSLNSALSGLRIAQQQIDVVSVNVANASTPGYTRKILPQSTVAIEGFAVGVRAETLIRNVDLNLTRDLWTQTSISGALSAKQLYLERIDQFHGPPDKELSVAAELTRLRDSFSALADSPEDRFLLSAAVNQAQDTASKINNLSNYITTLRNDAQNEIAVTVDRVNALLEQIAGLNDQIEAKLNINRSVAELQDQRDLAVEELSGLIDISFFPRGDGVLVIQTNMGAELASDKVTPLTFSPRPVSATTFYPDSVAGVYVGDPLTQPHAVDITTLSPGGKLGGLLELRDETFPKQMAQLDEMAHKLALRMEAQGLLLFTDATGQVPSDAPPDLSVDPPVAVAYVGFSSTIRVNNNILQNNALLQTGTYGATPQAGSNEVIRRVIDFAFGDVNYMEAIGSVDLRVSANAPPNNTLTNYLGLFSSTSTSTFRDLSAFLAPADLISSAGGALDPGTDTFRITLSEPVTGLGPVDLDISLAAIPDGAGNFVQDLITYITGTLIPALPAGDQADIAAMDVQFTETAAGEFSISSNATIAIAATPPGVPGGMGSAGLEFLGLAENTVSAPDPYFDVQVGNADPVRITIARDDDENDLMTKLAAVTGLAVEDITLSADGFLRIRPGNDYTNPDFGGDIRLIGGPFTADGSGVTPAGVNIVSALFGSYTGAPPVETSPITSVGYESETFAGSGVFVAFREEYLGPGASVSTEVTGSERLVDFMQKAINEQTQELSLTTAKLDDENTLKDILKTQLLNESGVNLDEELSQLIILQTSYAAAARVITAVDELFQELLNAV